MRVIVARCSVEYSVRLSARLPEALRLLINKSDGSVLGCRALDTALGVGQANG